MERAIERHLGEVEADDPVIRANGVIPEPIEYAGHDPFIPAGPQRGVGNPVLEYRFDADPRATSDQTDEDSPKTQSVRNPWPVTTQRVTLASRWDQRLDGGPNGIYHFGFKCAHDVGDLHLVVGWNAPRIKSGPSQRPVDGHLSARPLSRPSVVALSVRG